MFTPRFSFSESLQLYVPDDQMINKDFLKAVLNGQKSLLKLKDVKFVNPPSYDEISVKNLFPKF